MPTKITDELLRQAQAEGKATPGWLKLFTKEDGKAPKTTGAHTVILLDEQEVDDKDFQGNPIRKIEYIFEENGVKLKYRKEKYNDKGEFHYFNVKMAQVKIGQTIILEGGFSKGINFINFAWPATDIPVKSTTQEDIPVIQEEGMTPQDDGVDLGDIINEKPERVVPTSDGKKVPFDKLDR